MDHVPATLNPTAQEFRPTNTLNNPYFTYSYPFNFYNQPPPVYVVPPPLPPPSTTPTRTLLLSSVPPDVSESLIRRDLEVFGDVRSVQMEKIRDGIVTVHFYDIRQSMEALHMIQEQHMQQQCRLRKHFEGLTLMDTRRCVPPWNYLLPPVPPPAVGLIGGKAVWAQFTFPVAAGLPDGYNQGTVVVFNLDADVDIGRLKEIFEAYGCVKELRGTPSKKNQMFVEFHDTRDASKALRNMNGKEINGKPVVVEFSRPGGHKYSSKHNRLNPVCSARSPPIILARKFSTDSRPYRPPPPPPPPPMLRHCSSGSSKGGKVKSGNVVDMLQGGSVKKAGKKQVEQPSSGSVWTKQRKGARQMREKYDPRFLIKEDGIISESYFSDSRTTVMIKNIPNKYSQKLLLNMLDNHCIHCNEQITAGSSSDGGNSSGGEQPISSYDFVYLPIDFMNKCNVGYGFVNMTSPEATWRLYKAFHHQNWEVFNSKKICEVSYARLQGLEALKDHFKNSRFPCEAEEYMPVTFSPPRDGWRVTDPTPITGQSNLTTLDSSLCLTEEGKSCNSSSNNDNVTVVSDDSCNNSSNNYDIVASDGGVSGGDV